MRRSTSTQEFPANTVPSRRSLPSGVWAMGLVSLFMDASSEMVHSVLPLFLAGSLGASVVVIGIIEGIAEATAAITKLISGAASDALRRRKPLVLLGYGLAAATKPVFPLATSVGWVAGARFVDRVGKGIRGAPRDALVADLTPPALRGAAFGLRQALDSVGAVIGPLLALAVLGATAGNLGTVLWIATVPAVLAVLVLALGVREPGGGGVAGSPDRTAAHAADKNRGEAPGSPDRPAARAARRARRARPGFGGRRHLRRLPTAYWLVVGFAAVLTLARFSEAFLVLRAENVGLTLASAPLVMIIMNVVYAGVAYPAGSAADRFSRRTLLLLGVLALVGADLVLALAQSPAVVLLGAALWGLHLALTQGLLAKLVADAVPAGSTTSSRAWPSSSPARSPASSGVGSVRPPRSSPEPLALRSRAPDSPCGGGGRRCDLQGTKRAGWSLMARNIEAFAVPRSQTGPQTRRRVVTCETMATGPRRRTISLLVAACRPLLRWPQVVGLVPALFLPASSSAETPTRYPTADRVVALGDWHGDLDAARAGLRLAGAIDEHDRWVGGSLVVVQTGDQLDRGDAEQAILDLLDRLQDEAKAAGGAVHALLGNHELMNVEADFRYVTDGGWADFADAGIVVDPADTLVAALPAVQRPRAAAFRPGGHYARLLAERNVAVIVGRTLFVHGGVLPAHVAYGLERLNGETRAWLRGEGPRPMVYEDEDDPVWARHYSDEPGPDDCVVLAEVLGALDCDRMVVGHTVQEEGVTPQCEQRVWCIDTGAAAAYGGPVEALEITAAGVRVLAVEAEAVSPK